jgi:hypothetical protein
MLARIKPKMSWFNWKLMIHLYWYIHGQAACPYSVEMAVYPNEAFSKTRKDCPKRQIERRC